MIFNTIKNMLLDAIFPPICPVCGRIAQKGIICPACEKKVTRIEEPYCKKCGKPVDEGEEYCTDCQKRSHAYPSHPISRLLQWHCVT